MRRDIMVDIETLGTNNDSTVFQIAAISFDITTGEEMNSFNEIADISKGSDLNVSGQTLKWWLETDADLLRGLLLEGKKSPTFLLRDFYAWLVDETDEVGEENVYLWGNGILFDNKMIQYQLNHIGLDYPIHYKNDRDLRTLVELAEQKSGQTKKEMQEEVEHEEFVAHDAFEDVRLQIALAYHCYKLLMN